MRPLLRASLAVALLTLAACGGNQVSTIIQSVGGTVIAAEDLAFNLNELEVPADAAVSLQFDNHDSAPHNVAIYRDPSASEAIFVGDIFSGPGSRTYQLPAVAAGTYFFRCDVHPEMQGRLLARP
jgi:plastocyanin